MSSLCHFSVWWVVGRNGVMMDTSVDIHNQCSFCSESLQGCKTYSFLNKYPIHLRCKPTDLYACPTCHQDTVVQHEDMRMCWNGTCTYQQMLLRCICNKVLQAGHCNVALVTPEEIGSCKWKPKIKVPFPMILCKDCADFYFSSTLFSLSESSSSDSSLSDKQ